MSSFTTLIYQTVERSALTLLALARGAESDEELHPEEELELEVDVTYTPGWSDPGCTSGPADKWEPPSGEDPEITSVLLLGGDEPVEILDKLSKATLEQLTREANDHQAEEESGWADYAADLAYDDHLESQSERYWCD